MKLSKLLKQASIDNGFEVVKYLTPDDYYNQIKAIVGLPDKDIEKEWYDGCRKLNKVEIELLSKQFKTEYNEDIYGRLYREKVFKPYDSIKDFWIDLADDLKLSMFIARGFVDKFKDKSLNELVEKSRFLYSSGYIEVEEDDIDQNVLTDIFSKLGVAISIDCCTEKDNNFDLLVDTIIEDMNVSQLIIDQCYKSNYDLDVYQIFLSDYNNEHAICCIKGTYSREKEKLVNVKYMKKESAYMTKLLNNVFCL